MELPKKCLRAFLGLPCEPGSSLCNGVHPTAKEEWAIAVPPKKKMPRGAGRALVFEAIDKAKAEMEIHMEKKKANSLNKESGGKGKRCRSDMIKKGGAEPSTTPATEAGEPVAKKARIDAAKTDSDGALAVVHLPSPAITPAAATVALPTIDTSYTAAAAAADDHGLPIIEVAAAATEGSVALPTYDAASPAATSVATVVSAPSQEELAVIDNLLYKDMEIELAEETAKRKALEVELAVCRLSLQKAQATGNKRLGDLQEVKHNLEIATNKFDRAHQATQQVGERVSAILTAAFGHRLQSPDADLYRRTHPPNLLRSPGTDLTTAADCLDVAIHQAVSSYETELNFWRRRFFQLETASASVRVGGESHGPSGGESGAATSTTLPLVAGMSRVGGAGAIEPECVGSATGAGRNGHRRGGGHPA